MRWRHSIFESSMVWSYFRINAILYGAKAIQDEKYKSRDKFAISFSTDLFFFLFVAIFHPFGWIDYRMWTIKKRINDKIFFRMNERCFNFCIAFGSDFVMNMMLLASIARIIVEVFKTKCIECWCCHVNQKYLSS